MSSLKNPRLQSGSIKRGLKLLSHLLFGIFFTIGMWATVVFFWMLAIWHVEDCIVMSIFMMYSALMVYVLSE